MIKKCENTNEGKLLVHFDTQEFLVYIWKQKKIRLLFTTIADLKNDCSLTKLMESVDAFLHMLPSKVGALDNERVRLYATGVFQKLEQNEQTQLVIRTYVNHGLFLNILSFDLEQFYYESCLLANKKENIIYGIALQEFRRVVICGSFQYYLNEIGEVMSALEKYNTKILSPWTTKIVPETLGTDFILLEGQSPLKNERDTWTHKYEHMDKFHQADAIVICNPDGLVGKGTLLEIGYMVAISKRIIFTNRPKDFSILFPYEVGLNLY